MDPAPWEGIAVIAHFLIFGTKTFFFFFLRQLCKDKLYGSSHF